MLNLQQIKQELRNVRLSVVSAETGIHYNTLLAIRDADDANPTYDVLKKLNDYFVKKS